MLSQTQPNKEKLKGCAKRIKNQDAPKTIEIYVALLALQVAKKDRKISAPIYNP